MTSHSLKAGALRGWEMQTVCPSLRAVVALMGNQLMIKLPCSGDCSFHTVGSKIVTQAGESNSARFAAELDRGRHTCSFVHVMTAVCKICIC